MRVLLVLFFFSSLIAEAQCVDQFNTPTDSPTCHSDFNPVCGCDGVTYRNFCFAESGAQLLQWNDGPCEPVAVNLYPNPATNFLFVHVVTRFETNVRLFIYDRNGNTAYINNLFNVNNEFLTIPVNSFEDGLYIMMVEAEGYFQLLKFVRWEQ